MLMPGTKLTVSVELDSESMTPGAHFQWIVLSFSCFEARNGPDYGPNLDKGIDIVSSAVHRFSAGCAVSSARCQDESRWGRQRWGMRTMATTATAGHWR